MKRKAHRVGNAVVKTQLRDMRPVCPELPQHQLWLRAEDILPSAPPELRHFPERSW